jgi:uncharacterized protein YodC (DUF2158 family)
MFAVGDLVRLKSGGPRMTVDDVSPDAVSCSWFDVKGQQTARFKPATLVAVTEPRQLPARSETSWIRARRGR